MARILYIGNSGTGGTSRHRADALRRLGHEVLVADPYLALKASLENRWLGAFHYRTGYCFLQSAVEHWMRRLLAEAKDVDIAWVDNGELLGSRSVRMLNAAGLTTLLFNHDDPAGKRDGRRFDSMLKALAFYDLCAVVRQQNIQEYQALGAKNVLRIWMSYDEIVHAPYPDPAGIPDIFRSEVVFIGTWMRGEGRDQFVLDLLERGIPVSIWGQRWEKSPLWEQLKGCHRGGNLSGRDYVAAIQGAKVCLGMLSRGNRDQHTTRSMEIPYAGGVLCAERTSEHLELYREEVEAVFWSSADECARKCRRLLADAPWRESVRLAGMARIRASRHGHEDVCRLLVEAALREQAVPPAAAILAMN
ncbi:CgeB family protein [Polaromonas glacialis]|uniref:CgeB family protein n=1 Tax=Polaromonas glacialis TaxID=866564 RepID=UPI00068EC667|nr:glycosyltransferase [Polaromonas glacialis]